MTKQDIKNDQFSMEELKMKRNKIKKIINP